MAGSVSIRLDDEEYERFENLQRRIQEREPKYPPVTQKLVVLRAMERLEAHLDRLDRDKGAKE